jgi:hypothetical protein
MLNEVFQKVTVISLYDHENSTIKPCKFKWAGSIKTINKIGYYHKRKVGKIIFHVFDVTDGVLAYRLVCNSENLHWMLEEVADGNVF